MRDLLLLENPCCAEPKQAGFEELSSTKELSHGFHIFKGIGRDKKYTTLDCTNFQNMYKELILKSNTICPSVCGSVP
jgi:hypothetical protein